MISLRYIDELLYYLFQNLYVRLEKLTGIVKKV